MKDLENTNGLTERLRRVESPGVTTLAERWPIFWERARGCVVTDVDGHDYLDLGSAFGVMSVGHTNTRVVSAIARQAEQMLQGMGDVHPPSVKVQLLEKLAELAPPGLGQAVLGLNGSDSVEAALKCAQLVTGRSGVISFEGAYHGLSYGALSVTGRNKFRAPFSGRVCADTHFVDYPTDELGAELALSDVRQHMERQSVAALIIEPIQGRGGIRIPPGGFLKALSELCLEHGVLFIADEIFTGLGRTGAMFAVEYDDVVPDLMCVGKALGGGMPISACIGGATSLGQWPRATGEALHTMTFLGHPVSCAAAIAALDEIQERELVARARRLGELALDRLASAPVTQVRGRGLMIGLELESGKRAWRVVTAALEKGIILLPSGADGEVLSLTPPLIIDESDLINALDVLLLCLHETR